MICTSKYDATCDNYSEGILLLQNNLFKGLIPRWLCKNTNLKVLDLSRNRFTGIIHKCLWRLSLKALLLSSNNLSGVISSHWSNPNLVWLQLNDNHFNGEIPGHFIMLFNNLQVLDLGENKISGNIPEWIGENITRLGENSTRLGQNITRLGGNFPRLSALRLHNNNFTGTIPRSLCKSRELQILDLANNNLRGSIPDCFGEFNAMNGNSTYGFLYFPGYGNMMQVLKGVALEYTKTLKFVINMDLSNNKLVGEIPEALTELEALVGLNLSYNQFSGGIPKNIGMKSLNSLDLSSNELTGMIPPSITALNFLSHLNLSHNNLSGQIPTGNQLQTLTDPSIYADNTNLCGAPLPKECSTTENTRCKNNGEPANEPNKVWFYLDIIGGFATGFWGIVGVLLFKKEWSFSCSVRKPRTRYMLQWRLQFRR